MVCGKLFSGAEWNAQALEACRGNMRTGEGQSPCWIARCWLSSASAGQGICCELELHFSRACGKHAQFKGSGVAGSSSSHLKADEIAKCIVFVKRRYTARLLADLMASEREIGSPNLRIGLLIGTRYGDPGDVRFSFRQQIITLNKFRKGEINCLVSLWRLRQLVSALITAACTSIAEEGLDIPDCNTVINP